MYKYGVSIFTGLSDYTREENLKYLKTASEMGCEVIFSSAHINEAEKEINELEELVTLASSYGMKVSLDVSKPMMSNFNVPKGLYALRLDYGFSLDEIVEMSNNAEFFVELNVSVLNKNDINVLIEKGLNISRTRASFNYYPKLYTGHDIQTCQDIINECHKYNIPVLGFLPSKVGHRPPLYEGLPTIENHRYIDLDLAIEEMKAIGFDEIAFGDAYASTLEIKKLKEHQNEELYLYMKKEQNVPLECLDILEGIYRIRPDLNSYMIRVTSKRGKYDIKEFNTVERRYLDVTIDNLNFKRYKGEICIVLKDLPKDERVNVIGKLYTTEFLLESVKNKKSFRIIPIE